MRVIYKSKHKEVSPAVKEYIQDKIVRVVEKMLTKNDTSALLEVELSRDTNHHRKGQVWLAEANLTLGRTMIRAEEKGEDPHEVIDIVGYEIRRELRKFKTKAKTKTIRGARKVKRILRRSK